MLKECNGCEYKCSLSHIDICTLGSPCPHQRSTPMTNEEWLQMETTEQLAEWIVSEINERVKLALHDSELNDGEVDADFYMEDSDDWNNLNRIG